MIAIKRTLAVAVVVSLMLSPSLADSYKMTTPIAPGVATPDQLDTSIGPLKLFDGSPAPETLNKIYDNLDRSRALQAYLLAIPIVNQAGMRDSLRKFGSDNQTDVIWEYLVNPKTVELTANDNTVYNLIWLDTRKGPLVVEIPPKVLGTIDDFWYKWVADVGITGPDHGQGGKYLVLPPGYKGGIPSGFFVARANTYGSWLLFRSFLVDGSPKPGVDAVKKRLKIYWLSDAANPPAMNFIDASGKPSIRTQLFDASDIENVKKIQAGYRAMTLSAFQNKPTPPAISAVEWPKVDKAEADANPFAYLNFVLAHCPPVGPAAIEIPMRTRFAKIGVEAGQPFPLEHLSAERKTALEMGMKAGLEKIKQTIGRLGEDENGWRLATNTYGDRQAYHGNFVLRSAGVVAGIYGNDAVEALYPLLATTSDGKKPDTGVNKYTLTFKAGQLPPANAFWSVTMYDGKTQLLIENPIKRYLINSPMLPNIRKDADGSLTLRIQKDSPGKQSEANWLPGPSGPAFIVMRIYWPKEEALNGSWKPPAVEVIK